ncbi:hypothetical protein LX32DRAFT_248615 [Colletotrichum zoysiae]|uniref:Uncharacterized protein n=1 Tax=Colletotrichum zoysiae TaxID=1216348 RepID=A0AAD9H3H0_9PEZI|nr:hypothetical protein LX32DRAFT_248615 [Colletotrichum zoysiae]
MASALLSGIGGFLAGILWAVAATRRLATCESLTLDRFQSASASHDRGGQSKKHRKRLGRWCVFVAPRSPPPPSSAYPVPSTRASPRRVPCVAAGKPMEPQTLDRENSAGTHPGPMAMRHPE